MPPNNPFTRLVHKFPFTDLSVALNKRGDPRKDFLRGYAGRKVAIPSYASFRNALKTIYAAEPMQISMVPEPQPTWDDVLKTIKSTGNAAWHDMCVEVADCLFKKVRNDGSSAYEVKPQVLKTAADKSSPIQLDYYVVRGGEAIFQFANPRISIRDQEVFDIMMSMIHHAYVRGDYRDAKVEIMDLGRDDATKARQARYIRLDPARCWSLDRLSSETENVVSILRELEKDWRPS